MTSSASFVDTVIIGAGLSGLTAAQMLKQQGLKVLVLDKSRGVGGRLATRRSGAHVFDHGAQFFTAHSTEFKNRVEAWISAGVIRLWSDGFAVANGGFKRDHQPRYCGVSGMSSIAKHLASNLDVRLNQKVTDLRANGKTWEVKTELGEAFSSRSILLTAPVPQAFELLTKGQVPFSRSTSSLLEQMEYSPCLAVLVELAGQSAVPEPGGLWFEEGPISWMADNRMKGVSPAATSAVTIHAAPWFSQRYYESPEEEVSRQLLGAAGPWLGSEVLRAQMHRWRYSLPLRVHTERCLAIQTRPPLVLAGDAFGGPRVEGAILSGMAAALDLNAALKE